MTVQCCKCKKIHRDGGWIAERTEHDAHVTHSYCPICKEECYIEFFCEQASRTTCHGAQAAARILGKLASST